MVDLNEMILFARVVARKSFTEAGRELGLPASTLSRKVAALEERLGLRLLERTTRQLRLTEAGEVYYERCARLAREAEDADQSVRALQATPQGTLRVAAPRLLAEALLAPLLVDYRKRCPDVRVVMHLDDRLVDLVAEGYDVAIRVTAQFNDSSLVLRRLGHSRSVPCASPSYVREHGLPETPDQLPSHHSIIGYSFDPGGDFSWRLLDDTGQLHPTKLAPRVVVNSFWLTRELCRAGEGLALLPTSLADPDLADGKLVRVLPRFQPRPFEIGAVMPSARQTPGKVRHFLEALSEHLESTS